MFSKRKVIIIYIWIKEMNKNDRNGCLFVLKLSASDAILVDLLIKSVYLCQIRTRISDGKN